MLALLTTSKTWLVLAVLLLLIYFLYGGLTFINCIAPIKGYFAVFRDINGKIRVLDILFFCGMPAILATATTLHNCVTDEILNVIGVIIAILTSMIYSFMAIVNAKFETEDKDQKESFLTFSWLKTVHAETIDVITTEVLISVLLLVLCFLKPVIGGVDVVEAGQEVGKMTIAINNIISWLIYYCFYAFVLNLLIVTKRFYNITSKKN